MKIELNSYKILIGGYNMELTKTILNISFDILLIIGILSLAYAIIWTALFIPVIKLRKHQEKVDEANREYNKIETEFAALARAKQTTDAELKKLLYVIHSKQEELKEINTKLDQAKKEAIKTDTDTSKNTKKKTTQK